MRPGLILLVIAFALVALCTTAAKGDHTRMLRRSSPDFAQANDAVSNKVQLVRSSEIDDNKPINEERGTFRFSPTVAAGEATLTMPLLTKVGIGLNLERRPLQTWVTVLENQGQLYSHNDIKKNFDTLWHWYLNGKTPKAIYQDTAFKRLEKTPGRFQRYENEEYRKVVAFEKFYNILKRNPEQPWRLMSLERYDALKAQLMSHSDIKNNYKTFWDWHSLGKTPNDLKKDTRFQYLETNLPLVERFKDEEYRQMVSYEKFYNIVEHKKPSQHLLLMEMYDADINNFKTLWDWYVKGKTPNAIYMDTKFINLEKSLKDNLLFDKRFEDKDYRQMVSFEKVYNIMHKKKPSSRLSLMERYDATKAQLSTNADIVNHFEIISYWYGKKRKTPLDIYETNDFKNLERKRFVERFENEYYRQMVYFEKFYNIMNDKKPSKRLLLLERYDAVKAQLNSHADVKANLDKFFSMYVEGLTPDTLWKKLKLGEMYQKFMKPREQGEAGFVNTEKYQTYDSYSKFYNIMNEKAAA